MAEQAQFVLVTELPGGGRAIFTLREGDNVVGRGKDADIRIDDPAHAMSRRHVNVRVTGDSVELVDLEGTNGTYIKGRRVTSEVVAPGTVFDVAPGISLKLTLS